MSKNICRHCVAGVQLFNWCPNLSAGTVLQGWICWSGVETYMPAMCCRDAAVKAVSKPIRRHCAAGVQLFKRFWNHLPGNVLQGCRLFERVWTYLLGTVEQGAGCLSGVNFYLLSRLDGQNWIYCSTFILGLIRWCHGTCNCFSLGVHSYFFWERSIQLECQQVSLARLFYLTRRVCI